MSTIILPSRWRRQPTDGRLILAPSNQIAEGITAFFDPFTMRFGGSSPYGNATTPRYSPDGVAADVAITGSKFAEWSHDPRFAITGDISIGVVFDVDALSNYSGLAAKQATATTYAPFELRAGSGVTDSNFEFLRATSGSYKSWAGSGNRLSAGQRNVRFMVTAPSGIENSATGYLNGIEFALSTGSGAGSGAAQDNGASKLRIGTRADGATFLDGGIYLVCLWNRRLSSAEAIEWTQAPYQIFGKPKRILYFTAPSGGGATIAGSGTPTAQASTVWGTAERSVTGSGTPTAQASTVAGVAERVITSSGALASQSSAVAGSGSVGNAISGSGTLLAQSSQVAGTAERSVTGSGTPASQSATVSGAAERIVTGTGTPTSQSSTVSGTGQVGNVVTGSGSPTAQSATVSGTAERTVTSSGALSAQSSTVAGTAERTITGSGALSAQSSTVYGFDSAPVVPDTGGGGSRTVAFSSRTLRQELEEWEQKNQEKERLKRLMREDEELVLIMLALAA